MMGNNCTCTNANRRDAWRLGMIDTAPSGVIYGWVSCPICGGSWRTRAKYIRTLEGACLFKVQFADEDDNRRRIIKQEVMNLDAQIEMLQAKRRKLVRQFEKI